MRALRFNEFGDPAVLHVTDMPDPPATAQEAVIRVDSASVNPSDVKNVAGVMEGTVLPRIPGRDFAGVVLSGPPEWEGAAVWGTAMTSTATARSSAFPHPDTPPEASSSSSHCPTMCATHSWATSSGNAKV